MLLVRTEFLMLSMIIGILMLPVSTSENWAFDFANGNWVFNVVSENLAF